MTEYQFNSIEKNFIRDQWIEFARAIYDKTDDFAMLGLTTETLDDLKLFSKNGFYDISILDSGQVRINKGKFKCFEKDGKTFRKLVKLLPNETVFSGEIGQEIGKEYSRVFVNSNASKIFPCDVINLDFTGSISKVTKKGIINVFRWIFELQKKYGKSFSLFITFANTNTEDEDDVIKSVLEVIEENLSHPHTDFGSQFNAKYSSIDELKGSCDQFLATGISKVLVKLSSESKFEIENSKFYFYKKEIHNMISLLFNFKFLNDPIPPINIYKKDCIKCLEEIEEVQIEE